MPGKVVLKLDRRMIPEEDPARSRPRCAHVDRERGAAQSPGIRVEIRRLLLARALQAAAGQRAAGRGAAPRTPRRVFGEAIAESGTPLYTDVRLYGERGIPR